MSQTSRWTDFILPVGIVACVMVILVPLPAALLDVLLAANITIAIIILLTTIQVKTPLEFAIFPTLLLATTLGRVVLNIATTRLILSRGAVDSNAAAGGVIQAFGEFVAGNQITVGIVIFAIILIVQFVVITRGATRISEVAARFALDGLPGRQMAIDADLNAGVIDADTAGQRREELQAQADFYGTMDGASKFVRGDAIAGLLITGVNIVGGLAMGLAAGMGLAEAAGVFSRLTIGDGLVSQLPGLLISLAAGILISRSSRPANLSRDFANQLFSRSQVLLVAGGFVLLLVFTRLPALPMMLVGGVCVVMAWAGSRTPPDTATAEPAGAVPENPPPASEPDFSRFLTVDPIEIELGVKLIPLANDGQLLSRITGARQAMADELGIVLPRVRVRDNLQLGPGQFRIRIDQLPVCQSEVRVDEILLVRKSAVAAEPGGTPAAWHNGFGASWVVPGAAVRGPEYLTLEPAAVMVETLKQQARLQAARILTRQSTAFLIDQLRETHPATVDELVPDVMKTGQVQQVLQQLLTEGLTVKPLNTILEALADHYDPQLELEELSDRVRQRIAPWILSRLRDETGQIRLLGLHADLRLWLGGCLMLEEGRRRLDVDAASLARLREVVLQRVGRTGTDGTPAGLVVPDRLRGPLQRALNLPVTRVLVVGAAEIPEDDKIETIAILEPADVRYVAA